MGKQLKVRKNKKYTVMIIPRRGGKIKEINTTVVGVWMLIIFFIGFISYTAFVTYVNRAAASKRRSLKYKVAEQEERIEELKQQLYALENVNGELLGENRDLLEEKLEMNSKIEEITEMEKILAEALNDNNLKRKYSEIGQYAFADYTEAFGEKIKATVDLVEKVKQQSKLLSRIPSRLPASGTITSYFGRRTHPVTGELEKMHKGIDIGGYTGAPIYATADGVVTFAGYHSGFGKLVIIDHQNGYETYYAHNSSLLVSEGEYVKRDTQIAKMGSTGLSTGTHSHFEVRYFGTSVNPLKIIND
ncbi:M23 family metallopeptidase [Oceanirhabdus sp. W0125-5]|uniref:M23 family metallopeptidase n=1 Tax=Oceanirhabdus sp. W0125-5 TaxID=2999116 RepID=UPI0022F2D104|nr:peptidoglycan DD-metalloendopeptidase family protein [Oceanirhabdus sp. W0125-5]WBW99595.1 peptidoglycan DD-metalloendopeptidase family protein [Oceanirhabdus sp. W0125-5]